MALLGTSVSPICFPHQISSQTKLMASQDPALPPSRSCFWTLDCHPHLHKAHLPAGLELETTLSEAITGMFPSRELAQVALQFTANPKRFQENLFGGRFLKNLIQFNFTGVLGTSGKYSIGQFFQQEDVSEKVNGQGPLESAEAFSLEVSKGGSILSKPLVGSFGRTVTLQDNQNMMKFLSSILELPEFFTFLQQVISVPKSVAEDLGEVVKLALGSRDCGEEPRDL